MVNTGTSSFVAAERAFADVRAPKGSHITVERLPVDHPDGPNLMVATLVVRGGVLSRKVNLDGSRIG